MTGSWEQADRVPYVCSIRRQVKGKRKEHLKK
jgi:hypothetical protein